LGDSLILIRDSAGRLRIVATTQSDGSFLVDTLPPGDYFAQPVVNAQSSDPVPFTVPAGQLVDGISLVTTPTALPVRAPGVNSPFTPADSGWRTDLLQPPAPVTSADAQSVSSQKAAATPSAAPLTAASSPVAAVPAASGLTIPDANNDPECIALHKLALLFQDRLAEAEQSLREAQEAESPTWLGLDANRGETRTRIIQATTNLLNAVSAFAKPLDQSGNFQPTFLAKFRLKPEWIEARLGPCGVLAFVDALRNRKNSRKSDRYQQAADGCDLLGHQVHSGYTEQDEGDDPQAYGNFPAAS
jgi:hypothetical protein